MARVDVGLAGLGRIGRMHAANLAGRCGVARLACVFDADPVVAEKVARELEVPWTASFEELLDACDAVAGDFEERYPLAYPADLGAFARCVLDDTEPLVTGRDALAAVDLATACHESWRSGHTVSTTVKERA